LVYLLIAASCVVENFFPPSPSDVFVAMAGFLSHDGRYDPTTIFATAWAGGIIGAVAVYHVAATFGTRFAGSRVGRVVLPPNAMAFLLKEYGRYGVFGLLLTRLLPGFRSVVAPFAGLNRIPFWRFLLPVAAASGAWYAMLTFVGTRMGDQWDAIVRILNAIYSALGAMAGVVAVLLIVGFVLWRRRRAAS
jgi:membrane protein DedA with SNARE-associated domain